MSNSLEIPNKTLKAGVDLLTRRGDMGKALNVYEGSNVFGVELCFYEPRQGKQFCMQGYYGGEPGEWQHLKIPGNLNILELEVRTSELITRNKYTTEAYFNISKGLVVEVGQIQTDDKNSETFPCVKFEIIQHNEGSLWRVIIDDCGGFYIRGSEGNSLALVTGVRYGNFLISSSYIGTGRAESVEGYLLRPGN